MRKGRRWSAGSRTFLALAVVLGGASFLIVRGYAARVDALAPAIGSDVPVVTASRDLPRGTTLTADMLAASEEPSAYAPPGAIRRVEDAVGRTLVSDLASGEVLTRTRLGSTGRGPIASLVPAGLRAVTLPVGDIAGIDVGDHVDVLATFGGGQPHTETAGSGLEVIASSAGGSGGTPALGGDGSAPAGSLTVLVTPSDAENLAYASAFATLTVAVLGQEERVAA